MNKEFVPYEEALALKGLGFDEPCVGFYEAYVTGNYNLFMTSTLEDSFEYAEYECPAPLYQQVFRWFREKGYEVNICHCCNDNPHYSWNFAYVLGDEDEDCYLSFDENIPLFKTYEEAELACLRKLIEICQEKK